MKLTGKYFNNTSGEYHSINKKIVKEYNTIRTKEKRDCLCHAPFKSMCFYHTGDVLACWYNKLFPLGKYPEDSIHDIWFNQKAEMLRNYIKHNDLSYGCGDCRKALKAKNFYAVGAWRYDFLPKKTNEFPVSLDFQVSNSCNLQCIMCNGESSTNVRINRENQDLYTNPYDENFYKQIVPFIPYLKEASFSGGEPFFANEFYRIWDLIILLNPQIKISLTTNGNIMNDKVLKYLNSLSFNITLSLDAITEKTYKKIRVNGDFHSVLKNMDIFIEYTKSKSTDFGIKICPMRQNWNELPMLSDFLNNKNISFLYNTVIYPQYCSLWSLRSEKLFEILTFLRNHSLLTNTTVQKQNAIRYLQLIRQIEGWHEEAKLREISGFYSLNINQLVDMFIDRIQNYWDEELSFLAEKKAIELEKYQNLMHLLVNNSPNNEIALLGMQYYASAPIERILSEIEIRDFEKNRDRFVQIGRFNNGND